MSNFHVKHIQVVRLSELLGMENMTDRGAVFVGPDERPKPLPVFNKVQTRCHIQSSTGRSQPYVTLETSCHTEATFI